MLFLGDDWAEDHHDVELQDHSGIRLAKARLDEGVDGVAKLHELVARHRDSVDSEVLVGIETDRGPWVQALIEPLLFFRRGRVRRCRSGQCRDLLARRARGNVVA